MSAMASPPPASSRCSATGKGFLPSGNAKRGTIMTKRAKKGIGIAVTAVAAVAGLAIFNQHFKYVKPTWDYT